jgi:hypothetical protein
MHESAQMRALRNQFRPEVRTAYLYYPGQSGNLGNSARVFLRPNGPSARTASTA